MADEGIDLLWTTRNAFYCGAHQAAIAEAADLDGLSETDKLERDVFVYRAYVELGSYEVCCESGESGEVGGVRAGRRRKKRWAPARHWAGAEKEKKAAAPAPVPAIHTHSPPGRGEHHTPPLLVRVL